MRKKPVIPLKKFKQFKFKFPKSDFSRGGLQLPLKPKKGDEVLLHSWAQQGVRAVTVFNDANGENYDFTVGDMVTTQDGKQLTIRNRSQARVVALQFIKKFGLKYGTDYGQKPVRKSESEIRNDLAGEWFQFDTAVQKKAYRDITKKGLPEFKDWGGGIDKLSTEKIRKIIKRAKTLERKGERKKWYVTDMDRQSVTEHKTLKDVRQEVRSRIGANSLIYNKPGFYEARKRHRDRMREVYIIKEGTKRTGFEDLWKKKTGKGLLSKIPAGGISERELRKQSNLSSGQFDNQLLGLFRKGDIYEPKKKWIKRI